MKITKAATAGTLESSDVLVRIEPSQHGIDIEINSSVGKQFGDDIRSTIEKILNKLDIKQVQIIVDDKGALDCVLQARLKAALMRATDEPLNWEIIL